MWHKKGKEETGRICIHWFNPFAWLMGRELGRACELACDEAVICRLDEKERRAYGDTLLHALKTGGNYQKSTPAVMLGEGAKQLKERLDMIMNFKKSSKLTVLLSVSLTAALLAGAITAGAAVTSDRDAGKTSKGSASVETQADHLASVSGKTSGSNAKQAEKYYQAGNLPAFGDAFFGVFQIELTKYKKRSTQSLSMLK